MRFSSICPAAAALAVALLAGACLAQSGYNAQNLTGGGGGAGQQQQVELIDSYPYYMQSPVASVQQAPELAMLAKQQRATIPEVGGAAGQQASGTSAGAGAAASSARLAQPSYPAAGPLLAGPPQAGQQVVPILQQQQQPACLYDKRYFLKLDQCLERKPYPTVGLPAYRNDDLLIKKGLSDKFGCSFILTNGLFKNYAIQRYALESDTKCLDQDKTSQVSVQFSNVTLYYLWQLRCLNYADQLLDDATLGGRVLSNEVSQQSSSTARGLDALSSPAGGGGAAASGEKSAGLCVGSSQNFGFASLQLANIEAQLELSIDIYKNWRVTNVTLAMAPHKQEHAGSSPEANGGREYRQARDSYGGGGGGGGGPGAATSDRATGIRDFTFETLDGDELNWRYLHLYENWSRNRLHVNFLEQFRRFVWVSFQRCLSESSEKLPVKLIDLFGHHKYS